MIQNLIAGQCPSLYAMCPTKLRSLSAWKVPQMPCRLLHLCSVARTLLPIFQTAISKGMPLLRAQNFQKGFRHPAHKTSKMRQGPDIVQPSATHRQCVQLVFQPALSQSVQGPTCSSSALTIGGNCSSTLTIGGSSCGASTLPGVCLHRSPLPAQRRTLSGATLLLQALRCDKRMHDHRGFLSNPALASYKQHAERRFKQA